MKTQLLSILLADDDTDDCLFFKVALNDLNIATRLTVVHDGEQLMHLLKSETGKLPDVLFLDLNMPRKNGFECLSEIKCDDKLKQLPVVMFSTSFEQEVVNLLFKNGAHYFIRKPSEFIHFKTLIHQTLAHFTEKNSLQPTQENFVLTVRNNII